MQNSTRTGLLESKWPDIKGSAHSNFAHSLRDGTDGNFSHQKVKVKMAIERRDVIKNDLFVRPGMVLEKAKDGERIKIKNDLFVGEGTVLEKANNGKMRLTGRETKDNLQLERELEEDSTFEDKTFEDKTFEGETSSCCGSFNSESGEEDSENCSDDEEEDCSDDEEWGGEDEQRGNLSLLHLLTKNLAQVRYTVLKQCKTSVYNNLEAQVECYVELCFLLGQILFTEKIFFWPLT